MDIDLNLNNYTTVDLERFFGVSSNYTLLDVEEKKQTLLDKLLKININPQMQKDIILFLNNAKDKLMNQPDIIPKKTSPYVYSNPSDFFQGTFNPIEKRLTTKTICVDTFFRSNYKYTKSTDYTYTFPETINNVVSIEIKSIEIPYTWYNISALQKNNSFIIIDNTDTSHTITLPDGNYTLNDILTILTSPLDILNVQISVVPNSNRVNFICNTLFTLQFSSTGPVSLGWLLGFRELSYTGLATYTSESLSLLTQSPYFFIDVDDFHNNHITDAVISVIRNQTTPSYIGNNILARVAVPSTAVFNSYILNTQSSDYILKKREYFGPVKLEKMNIRILNRFGEVIDLNKNDYSIVFEVTQLYS
jgi:hypothetical protein